MKKNYWQSYRSSSILLLLIAALSVAGMAAVEVFRTAPEEPHLNEKLAAATLAREAMEEVKAARLAAAIPIDPSVDPCRSGLIGCLSSPVTSNNGHLPAKQTTVNPNFAAVVVSMLKDAGVGNGDVVAVGFSGSFPAMNICVHAAMQTLELRPVIISSASASQWGANHPQLLWLDMEKRLYDRGVFRQHSISASVGGIGDRGVGISPEGLKVLKTAIAKQGVPIIEPENYLDSVNQRMAFYQRHAGNLPVKAYINVGGGTTSVGTKKGKAAFDPGLNRRKPAGQLPVDSVMARFASQGVPVIHLVHMNDLAARYGLPLQPAEIPQVGEGEVYRPRTYNKWLAGGLLVTIVLSLYFAGRGTRSIPRFRPQTNCRHSDGRPAQMDEEPLLL